jgi:hypothetical protein
MEQDIYLHLRKTGKRIQVCQDYSFIEYPSQVIRRIGLDKMA